MVRTPRKRAYRLDLDVKTVATEIRIYADAAGKYRVPPKLKGDVTYGRGIKAIAAFLYSEGLVANDRICTFLMTMKLHFTISGQGMGVQCPLGRYLCKNTEETSNRWNHDMEMFLKGLNHTRNE